MKNAVLYVHGKGGSGAEADRLIPILKDSDVFGIDFKDFSPVGTREPLRRTFKKLKEKYGKVSLIANSIGAYFSMLNLQDLPVDRAYFISPVLDMESLINNMMTWSGVTEEELKEKGEIPTDFGETLSWEYLTFVREHPIDWSIPTEILYAGKDNLISRDTVDAFVRTHNSNLTVMKNGEHWFHTQEQLRFLDNWLLKVYT